MERSKNIYLLLLFIITIGFISCSENYSNGERIGLITQFSKRGIVWKSWEGHLNITRTGMNSADGFDFSLDNDNEDEQLVKAIDSAANLGWKVKLTYHQTFGFNWFGNRGETNYFIDSLIILDRGFGSHSTNGVSKESHSGKIIDTIYVVITPDNPDYKKFFK